MIRGNHYKHKSINLIIAFAVFWVSFASVINFHIQDNHGVDVLGHLEFVKTGMKTSFKKDSSLSFKIDLNSGPFILSSKEGELNNKCYSIFLFSNLVNEIYTGCFETPVLRGPPSFL